MVYTSDAMECEYIDFLNKYADARDAANIEYLGVNFSEKASDRPVFKAYYTTTRSIKHTPSLLQSLFERNMVHALNKIDDTINNGCVRYEIGLKNRHDSNMRFVYQWLCELYPELRKQTDVLKRFYTIKCTQIDGYQYASLYFLGLIADLSSSESPNVRAVKLHFLLRMCSDPDRIGRNYSVDNDNYLSLLHELGIPEMTMLSEFVGGLLKTNPGELWMAAVDYYKAGIIKYKIYLKKHTRSIYASLIEQFSVMQCRKLAEQIRSYVEWIDSHPELEQYGIAVCLDHYGTWSINLYH